MRAAIWMSPPISATFWANLLRDTWGIAILPVCSPGTIPSSATSWDRLNRKPVHGSGLILLPGLQFRRRERGLVRRIRKMLCLKTESVALLIHFPALAAQGPIQEIPRVKLDSRLVGQRFQDSPRFGIAHPRG